MTYRRFALVLTALAALAIALPTFANAAKLPKYHVYQKCDKSGVCSAAGYFNSKHTRAVSLQVGRKCSDGSYVSISFSGSTKVSSKGKFSVEVDASNYDRTNGVSVAGTGKLSGKVKKKDKVTFNYSIDKAPAACSNVLSGTITAKYKGTQSGG
jgi:hypothetical protein